MTKRVQSGQAAVETAIVMPLNLFLLLGIIQFGLISQARYMAKYAAYRAVRVGVMNHADHDKMVAAAEATLLPVIAMPANAGGLDVIQPTNNAATLAQKILTLKAENFIGGKVGLPMVDVVICGPTKGEVANIRQKQLTGEGSMDEVDFDDPLANDDKFSDIIQPDDLKSSTGGDKLKRFEANKLRIQVQFNYRMPIPFANWAISRMYLGLATADVLRLGKVSPWSLPSSRLALASEMKIYIAPIFEGYAMRMQSNYYLKKNPLPPNDECVTFAHANPNK